MLRLVVIPLTCLKYFKCYGFAAFTVTRSLDFMSALVPTILGDPRAVSGVERKGATKVFTRMVPTSTDIIYILTNNISKLFCF